MNEEGAGWFSLPIGIAEMILTFAIQGEEYRVTSLVFLIDR